MGERKGIDGRAIFQLGSVNLRNRRGSYRHRASGGAAYGCPSRLYGIERGILSPGFSDTAVTNGGRWVFSNNDCMNGHSLKEVHWPSKHPEICK
jgi:hypothetical protein